MRGAEESCFKLRGGKPDALLEHCTVEAAKDGGVGLCCVIVVGDRVGVEKPGPHCADAIECKWNASAVALVAAMETVDVIVTDLKPSSEDLARLDKLSVEVVIA